jgi:hypothetical protein
MRHGINKTQEIYSCIINVLSTFFMLFSKKKNYQMLFNNKFVLIHIIYAFEVSKRFYFLFFYLCISWLNMYNCLRQVGGFLLVLRSSNNKTGILLESSVKHHNPKTNCLLNINKECLFSQQNWTKIFREKELFFVAN